LDTVNIVEQNTIGKRNTDQNFVLTVFIHSIEGQELVYVIIAENAVAI